jgi:hypothetical protein
MGRFCFACHSSKGCVIVLFSGGDHEPTRTACPASPLQPVDERQALPGSRPLAAAAISIAARFWLAVRHAQSHRGGRHPVAAALCQHPAGFAALQRCRTLQPSSLDGLLFDQLPALSTRRQLLDDVIIRLCATEDAIWNTPLAYHNTRGVAQRKKFHALLLHFFNHQTHHRGQATTLLPAG